MAEPSNWRPEQQVPLNAAFYNVGIQSTQLDPRAQRYQEHMRRLEYDLGEIIRTLPELHALHLCEFGGHGEEVIQQVRDRVMQILGSKWSGVWDNNYVVFWRPSRLRMVQAPALGEVSARVRTQPAHNPHTFQSYTCCV